jgi:hypothetical protein
MEHHLEGRAADYPLIVVPEWDYLEPAFREALLAYVRGGGSLLLVGPRAAALFEQELRVKLRGEVEGEARRWLGYEGWLAGMRSSWQEVELLEGARPLGRLYRENDERGAWDAAASIARCGEGWIAATYLNLGERYLHARASAARDFLDALVRQLYQPMVEVRGSHRVDVAVNWQGDRLAINLVNTAGPHAEEDVYVYDEVPPVGPLGVVVRTGARPAQVTAEPGGQELVYDWQEGEVRLTLPRLEIHTVLVVEQTA